MWSTARSRLTDSLGSALWETRAVRMRRLRVVRILAAGVANEIAVISYVAEILARSGDELPERADLQQALLEAAEVARWELDTALYALHPR
jgi:hypothetical protein